MHSHKHIHITHTYVYIFSQRKFKTNNEIDIVIQVINWNNVIIFIISAKLNLFHHQAELIT